MKKVTVLLAVMTSLGFIGVTRAADHAKIYDGTDPVDTNLILPTDGTGCGTLFMNSDSDYENGYAWEYGGAVEPTYGAFAECYNAAGGIYRVCSAVFDLTQVGLHSGESMDIYVWNDAGGVPGNVICGPKRVVPGPIAFWPSLSRHVFALPDCCWDNLFWVGYWGNWPGPSIAPWYVGADLDGFGGCPLTNVAPGIGYPTGWTNVSEIWGPTQALGIGCEMTACEAVPAKSSSWGVIKGLYNR